MIDNTEGGREADTLCHSKTIMFGNIQTLFIFCPSMCVNNLKVTLRKEKECTAFK